MRIAHPLIARLPWRLRALFNLNDPGWGKDHGDKRGDNQGPPDLDELWRDFNRRLNGLFGRGNRGGGDEPPRNLPSGRASGFGIGVIVGVLAIIWLGSGLFIVHEGQVGVVLEFGKYKYTTRAGINWRLPWPIQTHEIVNLSGVRSVEIGRSNVIKATNLKDSSMLTEDENIIDVRFAVQYRLKDASEFLFNNRDAEQSVMQAAETAVREIVGRNKMDFVLYEGREKIALDLNHLIQKILDQYKTGILVTSVTMQNVQPPEQVQAAFDDAVKAGQDRERLKNEGQAYANEVVPRARGMAARLIQEAQGYKARVILQAEGDASRFKQVQAEYSRAPQVTRDRIYIDTMQQIYSNTTKVLVDGKQGNNLLYLPLDKLLAQAQAEDRARQGGSVPSNLPSGQQNQAVSAGTEQTPSAAAADGRNDGRSREMMRSRDRDLR